MFLFFNGHKANSQEKTIRIKSTDNTENKFLENISFENKTPENISEELKKHGYFLNEIDSVIENKNEKTIFIKLNTKINIAVINNKNKLFSKDTISFNELENFLNSISENEEKKGFLFSNTSLKNISIKKDTLFADVKTIRFKKRNIDKLIIKGYPEFSKNKIKRFLNLSSKKTLNNKKLQEISNNTKNLDFISEIKTPETLFKKDSTLLYLYLKKKKNSNFDGIVNFASKENEDGILFTGHLKLNLRNAFNSGEEINFIWEANREESQNLTLTSKLPYIFNSDFTSEINFKLHKQDTTFTSSTIQTSLLFNINTKTSAGISYSAEDSQNILINQTDENIQNFKNSFFGIDINFSNNKTNTFSTSIKPSFGKRTTKNSITNQFKFLFNTSYLHKLNNKNSIFIENETSLLITDSEITNELFRIGGANSIRGFDEESIFTSKYSFVKLEYHYFTSNKSYFYSITDFGLTNTTFTSKQFLGLGLGYSFLSKKNLLNLAYVLGKTKESSLKLNNSKIIMNFIVFF